MLTRRAAQVLVSNKQAGMVIGKGGVNVTKVLETTGARIRVSGPNEFFPLTMDRVVLITGTTEQLIEGVTQMMVEIMPTPEGQVEEAQQRRQVPSPCRQPRHEAGLGRWFYCTPP